eukprot:2160991-Rhodomonas_salina.1
MALEDELESVPDRPEDLDPTMLHHQSKHAVDEDEDEARPRARLRGRPATRELEPRAEDQTGYACARAQTAGCLASRRQPV